MDKVPGVEHHCADAENEMPGFNQDTAFFVGGVWDGSECFTPFSVLSLVITVPHVVMGDFECHFVTSNQLLNLNRRVYRFA